jgi:hypothetical protein
MKDLSVFAVAAALGFFAVLWVVFMLSMVGL